MIRFDGYYKLNSVPFEDSIANYSTSGYSHHAYLFLNNGTYIKAGKIEKKPETYFKIDDFNANYAEKYLYQNEQLVVFHECGKEWEFSEMFYKINDNLYINEKQQLSFTSW